MTSLTVSKELQLPLDAVTDTFGVLAVKRAGKSNAAVVMAEEMYDAGLPWVAIDPKGDWWGVRSSSDGRGPGLSVVVFGGEHGDVPLEPGSGALVAELVAEKRLTCVLDVSEMSKADQRRFLTAFAQRLYRTNRDPLHIFCEEADEYIPQRVDAGSATMVGAFETLVKRGGFRGIGVTLVTQRSASLNKDVLSQVQTLIALRTSGPQDRKAILDWVRHHDAAAEMVDKLPALANGQAYVFSPEWLPRHELPTLIQVSFRRRRTFDSGATPAVGVKRRTPTSLADVDLAAIKEQMADVIERAEAEDPKKLHQRIRELERQLAAKPKDPERVEVPVEVVPQEVLDATGRTLQWLDNAIEELRTQRHELGNVLQKIGSRSVPRARGDDPRRSTEHGGEEQSQAGRSQARHRPAVGTGGPLGKGERAVLSVLAQFPQGRSHNQLAFLTGYSPKASTISALLSTLRKAGLVEQGAPPRITDDGRAAIEGQYEPLPTGPALLDHWRNHSLIGKGERAVLDLLVEAYPSCMTHADLCDATGYSPSASTMSAIMSRLRKLELADGWRASDDFMESIR